MPMYIYTYMAIYMALYIYIYIRRPPKASCVLEHSTQPSNLETLKPKNPQPSNLKPSTLKPQNPET